MAVEAAPSALEALGINSTLLIAQLINFAVVLLVVWRWVWKPIMRILDERSTKIEKSLVDAKHIEAEVAALEGKRIILMRDAEEKANAIVNEALHAAESQRAEALAKTRLDVEQLVRAGREALGREKTQAVSEAKAELANLVIDAASKVLEESMDDKKHRAIVDRIESSL